MTEKTGTAVQLETHTREIAELKTRVSAIERGIWWAMGAASGVGAAAMALANGILKKLVA